MATRCGFAGVLVPLLLCVLHAEAPFAAQAADGEIRDVREAPPPPGIPPFAMTAGTVTGAAATAGYLILRRRKRGAPASPVFSEGADAPPQTPLQTLNRLAACYRTGELSPEFLCLNLAPLIRSTLAARSGLPASRLTTRELLQRMHGGALLPAADLAVAAELLELCDRVKFAGAQPDPLEAERFLAAVTRLASGELEEGAHEIS